MPCLPSKLKILLILAKNSWKTKIKPFRSTLFHKKTRVSLRYLVNDCNLLSSLFRTSQLSWCIKKAFFFKFRNIAKFLRILLFWKKSAKGCLRLFIFLGPSKTFARRCLIEMNIQFKHPLRLLLDLGLCSGLLDWIANWSILRL